MNVSEKFFLNKKEIAEILNITEKTANNVIPKLNKELKEMGKITTQGKVPTKYFLNRYGLDGNYSEEPETEKK